MEVIMKSVPNPGFFGHILHCCGLERTIKADVVCPSYILRSNPTLLTSLTRPIFLAVQSQPPGTHVAIVTTLSKRK